MRIVDTLLSIGAAMIAFLVYLDIYMNQTFYGHMYLSIVLARHWTLQYMINIAGCMAILSQLSYKETAKVVYYFYICFLVTLIAITEFPIMEDGWCQIITTINTAIFIHSLFHDVDGFEHIRNLLELQAEPLARLQ